MCLNRIMYHLLLKTYLFQVLLIVIANTSLAEETSSNLPKCKGDSFLWDNCFGSLNIGYEEYVGEFRNGKFHGFGTYTGSDGYKYVGGFKDGLEHGQGTYSYSDGFQYVGEFKGGL